jgi:hypothetical protein
MFVSVRVVLGGDAATLLPTRAIKLSMLSRGFMTRF